MQAKKLEATHRVSLSEPGGSRPRTRTSSWLGWDGWLEGARSCIEFWGGEPFVYLAKLSALVPRLRERVPHAEFSVIRLTFEGSRGWSDLKRAA